MRKWFLPALLILVGIFAVLYFLIPSSMAFAGHAACRVNPSGFQRNFLRHTDWQKWWPGELDSATWTYNNNSYQVKEKKLSTLELDIHSGKQHIPSRINLFPAPPDSVYVEWLASFPISKNPFQRFTDYFKAKKISGDLEDLLMRIQENYDETASIYASDIHQEYLKDSILVSMLDSAKGYPSTEFIYGMIDSLNSYVKVHDAKVVGYPMLNISTSDSISYLTRVALPVDRRLPSSGSIEYKWMMGGGKILISQITGGPASIQQGLQQLQYYLDDHRRITAAIPFQSLITNRRSEPDTSKWVTRLFYPVM